MHSAPLNITFQKTCNTKKNCLDVSNRLGKCHGDIRELKVLPHSLRVSRLKADKTRRHEQGRNVASLVNCFLDFRSQPPTVILITPLTPDEVSRCLRRACPSTCARVCFPRDGPLQTPISGDSLWVVKSSSGISVGRSNLVDITSTWSRTTHSLRLK